MHRLLLLTAFFLSACASTPGNSDVDMRAASWQGAPTSELIAVLGEPKIGKSGNLTWRFPGPEDPQARLPQRDRVIARISPTLKTNP